MNIIYSQSATCIFLPDWQPPSFPPQKRLCGQYCSLIPLTKDHCEALFHAYSLAETDRDWIWLGAEKPTCMQDMLLWVGDKINASHLVSWTVTDNLRNQPVGVVCYSDIDTDSGSLEIGHVTWSPLMQRTRTGTEALFLLLKNAFDLGYRRVAWRCDSLNVASARAAMRVGFKFEGRFRQAMVRKQRNRDTDWFSVIDGEWPHNENALTAWLSLENFTERGEQKRKLASFFQNNC